MQRRSPVRRRLVLLAVLAVVAACAIPDPDRAARHRWWEGLGPVLPHDTFPGDCKLCHVGEKWHELTRDFHFDHAKETGVPLLGAHAQAKCLRCHNDRGPVQVFKDQGCAGCHADVHYGELGVVCTQCHDQATWQPQGMIARHDRSRFPLTGAHAMTACNRCHPGSFVGNFLPADNECVTCHTDDLLATNNPPHVGLGWVDHCDRCHMPTDWHQAQVR